jgi:hypothetical protein
MWTLWIKIIDWIFCLFAISVWDEFTTLQNIANLDEPKFILHVASLKSRMMTLSSSTIILCMYLLDLHKVDTLVCRWVNLPGFLQDFLFILVHHGPWIMIIINQQLPSFLFNMCDWWQLKYIVRTIKLPRIMWFCQILVYIYEL